uniref:Uncharacterized protein n=1 Tax=Rhizophora mucronata TaxID=61149 RepID=A0A2P2NAZ4_RHIMU
MLPFCFFIERLFSLFLLL